MSTDLLVPLTPYTIKTQFCNGTSQIPKIQRNM